MAFGVSQSSFPQLETERLLLRETTLNDVDAIFALFSDPAVTQFHDLNTFTERIMAHYLIERRAQRFNLGYGIRWGIALKPSWTLIGSCGFTWHKPTQVADVGYELAPTYWRQGIMTEALRAILQFGFEQAGVQQVNAQVMLHNIASRRLLEKLNFQSQGILKDYGFWKGQFHDVEQFMLAKARYCQSPASES